MNKNNEYSGTGIVFNIQRWAIQDGPGMRTTVFLKGCPLTCGWCANPESQNRMPEIMTRDILCIGCGKCKDICPEDAISFINAHPEETIYKLDGGGGCQSSEMTAADSNSTQASNAAQKVKIKKGMLRKLDWQKCTSCLKCAGVCPAKALIASGEEKDVRQVMTEVLKDMKFYRRSKGGMTISGGEPLVQWEFTLDLLKYAKKKGLNTALDTTGAGPWKILNSLLEYTNLLLYDIKHMDAVKHKEATGIDNKIILENLEKAVEKCTVWIRRIVVPGFNDSNDDIKALGKFVSTLTPLPAKISLLPYHKFAAPKYKSIGRIYQYEDLEPPKEARLKELQNILESVSGIKVDIGK
ncbi:MAG TPA: glycyl-radical enzyme activating protein [Desulfobacteraceae bacterium]|nr:glycyl-radical enzyme activating protein [Desulfobacteraceae bacterium]